MRLSGFLFARIISTKSDARFDSFFIHEGEPWFTAPTYYPLKLSFMWIMQVRCAGGGGHFSFLHTNLSA